MAMLLMFGSRLMPVKEYTPQPVGRSSTRDRMMNVSGCRLNGKKRERQFIYNSKFNI
jgi:hypothetical protein